MGLFDLPQELIDFCFDLAYSEEEFKYVTRDRWESREMGKKRWDATHALRPFPEPKVCKFLVSKRFSKEALRAWAANQDFNLDDDWIYTMFAAGSAVAPLCQNITMDAARWRCWIGKFPGLKNLTIEVSYDVFAALDPNFAWKCAYTEEDLMTVARDFFGGLEVANLKTLRLTPGYQPYSKTKAEARQWEENIRALGNILVPALTGPKEKRASLSPRYCSVSPQHRPASPPFYPGSSPFYPTSPSYNPSSPSYNCTSSPSYCPTSPTNNRTSSTHDPTSPRYCPTSPPSSHSAAPLSPGHNPTSPSNELAGKSSSHAPTFPQDGSGSPLYSPPSPVYHPTSPVGDYEAYTFALKSPQQGAESPVYSPTTPMGGDEACLSRIQSEHGAASPMYSPTTPLVSPNTASYASKSPKFCPTSPCYCADSPSLCPTSSKYDSTRPRPPLPEHHIAEHIGHLVDASERSTGPWKELNAGDVPGSVEEIIRLAVNNPKGFLGWLKKTKNAKAEATDPAEKICEQDLFTAGNASRELDTDVPFLDIAQTQRKPVEGSPLSKKMEPKPPNGGRKRRIDCVDISDDVVTSKKRRTTTTKDIADKDSQSYNNADSPPQEPVKQGDGAVRKGGNRNGESWLTLARAGEIDSAADQLQSAIQSTLIVMGWPKRANYGNLAGYMAFMVLMGKDEEHVRKELGGDTLGLSRYDATTDDLARWLFRHVSLLEV